MVDLPFDKEHRLTSTFDKPGSLGLAYATDVDGKVFITKIMPGSQASKLLQLQKCARSCASTSAALKLRLRHHCLQAQGGLLCLRGRAGVRLWGRL